jgi:hypothetical protein
MNVKNVYIQLAPAGHIARVLSHDGKYDKLVVNNPWLVANPAWIFASQFLVGMACLFALCGIISGHGAILAIATIIITIAMGVCLHAPAASRLATWNDFLTLGDTCDFPLLGAVEFPARPAASALGFDAVRDELAAIYGLEVSVESRSVLEGLTSYDRARMALLAAQALIHIRKTPFGFFAACLGLGMGFVVVLVTMLGRIEMERAIVFIGPFAFFSSVLAQTALVPRVFSGRIMPYRGALVMHQHGRLNQIMDAKALLGLAASALATVHVWGLITAARYAVNADAGYDEKILAQYPTPVPRIKHALLVLPLSIGAGLLTISGYGKPAGIWPLLPLVLSGVLGLAALMLGASTDILKHLSHQGAVHSTAQLDRTLDRLFRLDPQRIKDRLVGTP